MTPETAAFGNRKSAVWTDEGNDPLNGRRRKVHENWRRRRHHPVRTMILDVEPFVAPWHSSQESLDQGIEDILSDVRTVPSVQMVVFATNSARRPSALAPGNGIRVKYLASAEKPLRIAPYQGLPRPGTAASGLVPARTTVRSGK
jgi:hypothetical protein